MLCETLSQPAEDPVTSVTQAVQYPKDLLYRLNVIWLHSLIIFCT